MGFDKNDWSELYRVAEKYIRSYVPEATINKCVQKTYNGVPRVEASFPLKSNKRVVELMRKDKRIAVLRGRNIDGKKIMRCDVIFNKNDVVIFNGNDTLD